MNLSLNRLYNPNGKNLGSLVAGLSGSGKTTAIVSTLQQAIAHPKFGEFHRFVIIDPKHQVGDYDLLADPETDYVKIQKSISQNRTTLIWPDLENLEQEVGDVVDYIFDMANSEPRSSFTLILDEASILITPTRIDRPPKNQGFSHWGYTIYSMIGSSGTPLTSFFLNRFGISLLSPENNRPLFRLGSAFFVCGSMVGCMRLIESSPRRAKGLRVDEPHNAQERPR